MKRLILNIFLIASFSSCKNVPESSVWTNHRDINGNIVGKYHNYDGTPNQTYIKIDFHHGFDSVFVYYRNGDLYKRGKQYRQGQKNGKWELFDSSQRLREIREWFTVNGKSRINRVWHLNKNGDTLAWRYQDSIYYQKEFFNDTVFMRSTTYDEIFFNRDTVRLNEAVRGYVEVRSSLIRDRDPNLRVILANPADNFDYDFSNEDEINPFIFYDLTLDSINRPWFPGADPNYLTAFGVYFDKLGINYLRGYYQQYWMGPSELDENGMKTDSLVARKFYFEKKVVVVDSI